jgi:hypothetical protein
MRATQPTIREPGFSSAQVSRSLSSLATTGHVIWGSAPLRQHATVISISSGEGIVHGGCYFGGASR